VSRLVAGAVPLPGGKEELAGLLAPWLARQEWARSALGVFGTGSVPVRPVDVAVLRAGRPGLASVVVDAGSKPERRLHVLVGWSDPVAAIDTLDRPGAVLGTGTDEEGEVLLYEALADAELCLGLLEAASSGRERAARVRVVKSLASHSALVYDERLFMKCYRVIERRPRPEIEMMTGLDRVGFNHLLAPVAHWSRPSGDLGLVREFLPGAVEGRTLALTSLRDLLARASPGSDEPAFEEVGLAGGDLGDEMRRLGATTAELHLALAEAFGARTAADGGVQIRIHGDYHLRRVMRVDTGWLVAGFGDDPLIGPHAGLASQGEPRMACALEDVLYLFVSLRQAADEATSIQPESTLRHARLLADGWVRHNRAACLEGYRSVRGIESLVGSSEEEIGRWLHGHAPGLPPAVGAADGQYW
jgi:hypothetical protein